jgi:hypothetical protein
MQEYVSTSHSLHTTDMIDLTQPRRACSLIMKPSLRRPTARSLAVLPVQRTHTWHQRMFHGAVCLPKHHDLVLGTDVNSCCIRRHRDLVRQCTSVLKGCPMQLYVSRSFMTLCLGLMSISAASKDNLTRSDNIQWPSKDVHVSGCPI